MPSSDPSDPHPQLDMSGSPPRGGEAEGNLPSPSLSEVNDSDSEDIVRHAHINNLLHSARQNEGRVQKRSDGIKLSNNNYRTYNGHYENAQRGVGTRKRAMYPYDKYQMLVFPEEKELNLQEKFRWSDKHCHEYKYEISIPNKESWWYNKIYVLRSHPDIIE